MNRNLMCGLVVALVALLSACGSGGSSSTTSTPAAAVVATSTVSGQFQFVTVNPASTCSTGGSCALNFLSPQTKPGRGLVVDLLNASTNAILASSITSATGNYSFTTVTTGISVKVRVYAKILNTGKWDASVIDNTASGALYAMDSASAVTANNATSTLNLLAGLGYSTAGVADDAMRKSGPFVIADTLYTAYNKLLTADSALNLPALNVNWSVKNISNNGTISSGQIGTSYWDGSALYILGKSDNDSDEFDVGVVGHEFGHYLQSKASYSDSPGGSHNGSQNKDFSLSYGEGYGTAIGALLTNLTYYYDTSGSNNATGSGMVLGSITETGAYREDAVIKAIYLLGKDGGGGLTTLWSALKNMRTQPYSATIFGLAKSYTNVGGTLTAGMTTLLGGATDGWGTGYADSSANVVTVLTAADVYILGTKGTYTNVCHNVANFSAGDTATGNRLGSTRRLVYLNVPAGSQTLSVQGALPSGYASLKIRDSTGELSYTGSGVFTKAVAGDVSVLIRVTGNATPNCADWRIN